MTISIISAVDSNLLIGDSQSNQMPWRNTIPEDLKFFREQTLNQVVVMGHNTFKSLNNKPLSYRTNIILTNHHFHVNAPYYSPSFTVSSVQDVLNYHEKNKCDMYIIGGSQIYQLFLPYTDSIILTHIDHSFTGDVYFPLYKADLIDYYESEIIREVPISDINPYHLTMKKYTPHRKNVELFSRPIGAELI